MYVVLSNVLRELLSFNKLRNVHNILAKEQVYKLLFIIVVMVTVSGVMIAKMEHFSVADGVWWSIVTMTTVGYGDVSPKTIEGRGVAVFLMICGISVICMLTGKIAEFMVYKRVRKMKGFSRTVLKNHIIICNWNGRALDIIKNIKAAHNYGNKQIVVIDDKVDSELLLNEDIMFYKGVINEEMLKSACLNDADTVIILGDSALDHIARDAKCVLDTLTVESINPNVYTIVELVDSANETYCKRAHADEVISGFTIGGNLIAQTALNHGMSTIISDILCNSTGSTLSILDFPPLYTGTTAFHAVADNIKKEMNMILLGVQNKKGVVLNPESDYFIDNNNDRLVVFSTTK